MIKVVHYINQFFAQIGGEEMAHVKPEVREGIVGPGAAFNAAFKGEAEIVATVYVVTLTLMKIWKKLKKKY